MPVLTKAAQIRGSRLAIGTALMPVLMPETSLMPALMPAEIPLKQWVLATLALLALDPEAPGRTIRCAFTGARVKESDETNEHLLG